MVLPPWIWVCGNFFSFEGLRHMNTTYDRYVSSLHKKAISAADQQPLWEEWGKLKNKQCPRGQALHNKLFEANLLLVVAMVNQKCRGKPMTMDLIQEGNIGLLKAIEKYDVSRKLKFSTYASYWIMAKTGLASKRIASPVHVPTNLMRAATLPQACSLDTSDMLEVEDVDPNPAVRYEEMEAKQQASSKIAAAAAALSESEKFVLYNYVLKEKPERLTLREIGERYDVSRELVRQWVLRVQQRVKASLLGKPMKRPLSLKAAVASSLAVEVKSSTTAPSTVTVSTVATRTMGPPSVKPPASSRTSQSAPSVSSATQRKSRASACSLKARFQLAVQLKPVTASLSTPATRQPSRSPATGRSKTPSPKRSVRASANTGSTPRSSAATRHTGVRAATIPAKRPIRMSAAA